MRTNIKSYSELIQIPTFEERIDYLRLSGTVGDQTFGGHRYLNQVFYNSERWKETRRKVIVRDNAYDLADLDHPIIGTIYVHHIEPLTLEDIREWRSCLFDLENLISTSFQTHNIIHYGMESNECPIVAERTKYDTCPWR